MLLTRKRRTSSLDPDSFPAGQLFLLALVRVAEPVALTSLFPFAWKLILYYRVGTETDAAFYAGLLIGSFSLAEALTGVLWGSLSDRIGRKKVLLIGTAGTLISLLIVGFAQNFWVALCGRILGGLLNGNVGVIQTMVGELVRNPKHEPRAFAVMPFVWSIGTIIGPTIGGYFADPSSNWPGLFPADGLFGRLPYLLPNLICAVMLGCSMLVAKQFLDETHPDMQPWSTPDDLRYSTAQTPLIATSGSVANAPTDLSQESYGTFDQVSMIEGSSTDPRGERKANSRTSSPSPGCAFTPPILMLITALGIFTYHSMTYDHLMPIFFQDAVSNRSPSQALFTSLRGGLGISTQNVGLIMSVNGVIALFVQGVVFPLMASWLGVWRLFIVVTVGHPLAFFIVPFLVLLPPNMVYVGIYACLFVRNLFSILAYPLLLILIKEASPAPAYLGKINGLAASVGGACRTVASPVAGFLYGIGSQVNFAPLPWWASGLVAVVGALQMPWIERQKNKTTLVRSAVAWRNDNGEGSNTGDGSVRLV